jgi:hypothetical protein
MDSHDTLSFRLAGILVKLNNGEKLDPHQLAQEYKVNLRTLTIDKKAVDHFKRRQLVPAQQVIKHLSNGFAITFSNTVSLNINVECKGRKHG